MDLTARFQQPQTWAVDLSANPYWRQKTRLIEALIPEGVDTILDVGCGNGALADRLAERYQVFGLDGSKTALAHVKAPAVETWVDRLPLKDHCADLVLCSEVLEHLPTAVLDQAVKELTAAAGRQ